MKRHFAILVCLGAIHQTSVKGARIDMQTHRALIKFRKVQHLVNGFFWIYFCWQRLVNIEAVSFFKTAIPRGTVLVQNAKVLHSQPASRNGHPAVLIMMVMNLRDLSDLPTDRQQLKKIVLKDQVSRVMVFAEEGVRPERILINHPISYVIIDNAGAEIIFWNRAQTCYKLID